MNANRTIFWSLLTRGLTYILIILQGMIVARLLGPEGKGVQAKLIATASLLVFIFDFGISNSINYFLSNKKIDFLLAKKLLLALSLLHFSLCVMVFALFQFQVVKDFILPPQFQNQLLFLYVVVSTFIDVFKLCLNSFLMSLLKFKMINWIDFSASFLRILAYIYVFFFSSIEQNLILVLAIDIMVNIVVFIGTASVAISSKPTESLNAVAQAPHWSVLRADVLKYSLPLFASNILIYMNTRLDYWVIERHLGLESLGYYAVANSGAQILTIISAVVGAVIFSYLNKLDGLQKVKFFSYYSRHNIFLTSICALLAFIAAPFLIPFLFGDKFLNSIFIFQGLIFITVLQSYRYLLGIYLQSTDRNYIRLKADLTSFVLNVLLLYPMVKYGGLTGLMALFFISQLVGTWYINYTVRSDSLTLKDLAMVRRDEIRNMLNIEKLLKKS